ncbi:hypothetical protein OUZ56_008403 [Daphnia magna]|uniref:Uncharacterized protein n=1 Tax=Daphnia magna TaxID=35525 RepID=A0ABR0ACV3_9CRUS|nr:hypothetical protein OUZ56_008403 [Daphnia magna]
MITLKLNLSKVRKTCRKLLTKARKDGKLYAEDSDGVSFSLHISISTAKFCTRREAKRESHQRARVNHLLLLPDCFSHNLRSCANNNSNQPNLPELLYCRQDKKRKVTMEEIDNMARITIKQGGKMFSKKKKKKKKRGSAASDREEGNSHAIPFAYTIHIKYNENSI